MLKTRIIDKSKGCVNFTAKPNLRPLSDFYDASYYDEMVPTIKQLKSTKRKRR